MDGVSVGILAACALPIVAAATGGPLVFALVLLLSVLGLILGVELALRR